MNIQMDLVLSSVPPARQALPRLWEAISRTTASSRIAKLGNTGRVQVAHVTHVHPTPTARGQVTVWTIALATLATPAVARMGVRRAWQGAIRRMQVHVTHVHPIPTAQGQVTVWTIALATLATPVVARMGARRAWQGNT